jgi:prepilin-type processing-associated H-X9-DG protein
VTALSVLTLLAVLALPALGHGTHKTKALECMENFRRLGLAWMLYANDHEGVLALSFLNGTPAWVSGTLDWSPSSDNTNVLKLIDPRYGQLADYVGRDATVFKCPEDDYLSSVQRARGWKQRVRSYSCSGVIGPGYPGMTAIIGPDFAAITRLSEFRAPAPAECYAHLEEHPDSINDSAFFTPNPSTWVDLPASFHTRALNVSFADGHVELHQWQSSNTVQRVRFRFPQAPVRPNDPDILWLRDRTPRK